MSNSRFNNLVNFIVLTLLPIYIGVHIYLLPQALSEVGIMDEGFISIATLAVLAWVLVMLLTFIFNSHTRPQSRTTAIAAAYIVLIYFLREADFHRLFTVEHVTRGTFYIMPNVPLWQKVFSVFVFALLLGFVVYLLFNHVREFWHKARALEPWAVAICLWFTVLLFSQLCDRSGLQDFHFVRVIEECCECWAAIFLLLATVQIIPSFSPHSFISRKLFQFSRRHD